MFADVTTTAHASSWKNLRTLCAVRVLIAGSAVFILQANAGVTSATALTTAWGYLTLTLAALALSFAQRPRYVDQLAAALAVDLLCISLLVLASPGGANGLQMLFFAPVAGAALLSQLPVALFVAATVSIVLLSDALLRQLGGRERPVAVHAHDAQPGLLRSRPETVLGAFAITLAVAVTAAGHARHRSHGRPRGVVKRRHGRSLDTRCQLAGLIQTLRADVVVDQHI